MIPPAGLQPIERGADRFASGALDADALAAIGLTQHRRVAGLLPASRRTPAHDDPTVVLFVKADGQVAGREHVRRRLRIPEGGLTVVVALHGNLVVPVAFEAIEIDAIFLTFPVHGAEDRVRVGPAVRADADAAQRDAVAGRRVRAALVVGVKRRVDDGLQIPVDLKRAGYLVAGFHAQVDEGRVRPDDDWPARRRALAALVAGRDTELDFTAHLGIDAVLHLGSRHFHRVSVAHAEGVVVGAFLRVGDPDAEHGAVLAVAAASHRSLECGRVRRWPQGGHLRPRAGLALRSVARHAELVASANIETDHVMVVGRAGRVVDGRCSKPGTRLPLLPDGALLDGEPAPAAGVAPPGQPSLAVVGLTLVVSRIGDRHGGWSRELSDAVRVAFHADGAGAAVLGNGPYLDGVDLAGLDVAIQVHRPVLPRLARQVVPPTQGAAAAPLDAVLVGVGAFDRRVGREQPGARILGVAGRGRRQRHRGRRQRLAALGRCRRRRPVGQSRQQRQHQQQRPDRSLCHHAHLHGFSLQVRQAVPPLPATAGTTPDTRRLWVDELMLAKHLG